MNRGNKRRKRRKKGKWWKALKRDCQMSWRAWNASDDKQLMVFFSWGPPTWIEFIVISKKGVFTFPSSFKWAKKSPACGGAFCTPVNFSQASASLPPHGFYKKEKSKIGARQTLHVKMSPQWVIDDIIIWIEFLRQPIKNDFHDREVEKNEGFVLFKMRVPR